MDPVIYGLFPGLFIEVIACSAQYTHGAAKEKRATAVLQLANNNHHYNYTCRVAYYHPPDSASQIGQSEKLSLENRRAY